MKARILVTNDDGIHSPGLRALVEELAKDFELLVIAPERQQSAAGHSITLHKPLRMDPARVGEADVKAFQSNGTPADCIVLGTLSEFGKPDMVVSGINAGANLGEEIFYSGTVSAAMEAAIQEIPAFSISVDSYDATIYEPAAEFARHLAHIILETGLPSGTFLNVNVPHLPKEKIVGVAITRLGRRSYRNQLQKRTDPRGRPYYWFSGAPQEVDSGPDTDIGAVKAGKISITPVQLDATNYALLEQLRGLEEKFAFGQMEAAEHGGSEG